MRPLLLAAATLFPAASALAQLPAPTLLARSAPRATWSAVTSAGLNTTNTTFRCGNPGAASSSTLYAFGGSLNNNTATTLNDLYAFDPVAGTFTQLIANSAAGSPAHRSVAAVAWNPATNRLVVFGGNTKGGATGTGTSTLLNDIWEWDPAAPIATSWTNVTPAAGGPSPRQGAAMAYDPVLGGMLLFGGQTSTVAPATYSSETWLFLGGAWIQLTPATVPPARSEHSLVTRTDFNDVLLCCGFDHSIAAPDQVRYLDVWTWNGGNWTKISDYDVLTNTGTSFPASCVGNQAVYDPLRKRVVVQGGNGHPSANTVYVYGSSYGGSPTNYTSEFDCLTNTWSIYASPTTGTAPFNNTDTVLGRVSRYFGGFVAATGKVYKACGQDPTKSGSKPTYNVYEYQAATMATATAYGAGCAGPGGPLTLVSNSAPWTSRTWTGTCTTVGPASLTLAVWGAGTASLPLNPVLPIAPLGCDLLNTAETLLGPDVPVGGAATVSLPIPAVPTLAGLQLHVQVAELEFGPGFAWNGLYTSNGVTLTIGAL